MIVTPHICSQLIGINNPIDPEIISLSLSAICGCVGSRDSTAEILKSPTTRSAADRSPDKAMQVVAGRPGRHQNQPVTLTPDESLTRHFLVPDRSIMVTLKAVPRCRAQTMPQSHKQGHGIGASRDTKRGRRGCMPSPRQRLAAGCAGPGRDNPS